MKKFLLVLSMICFIVSMVCSWFKGSIGYGIGFTIAMLLFIWLTRSLISRHTSTRFIVVAIIAALSIFFASMNISLLAYRKNNQNVDKAKEQVKVTQSKEDGEEHKEKTDKEEPETKKKKTDKEKTEEEETKTIETTSSKETAKTAKANNEAVVVEKIVEKRVEVPVEKVVEKVEYVEVPVVEYVEVPVPTIEPEDVTPPTLTTPQYGYSGDPTNPNYAYGYSGDPTMGNYRYGYGSNYGDPTKNNNNNNYNYSTITISGNKNVELGETVKYTISGVSSISKSRLNIPYGVSIDKISGNKVYLTFEAIGSYYIGYESSTINVKVSAD